MSMKFRNLSIVFSLSVLCLFTSCQEKKVAKEKIEKPYVQRMVKNKSKEKVMEFIHPVTQKKVSFSIVEQEESNYAIVWKEDTITTVNSPGGIESVVAELTKKCPEGMFLLSEMHGDACSVMYKLLDFTSETYKVTEAFGNCLDLEKMIVDEEAKTIIFHFSALDPEIESYKKASFIYNMKTHQLGPLKKY